MTVSLRNKGGQTFWPARPNLNRRHGETEIKLKILHAFFCGVGLLKPNMYRDNQLTWLCAHVTASHACHQPPYWNWSAYDKPDTTCNVAYMFAEFFEELRYKQMEKFEPASVQLNLTSLSQNGLLVQCSINLVTWPVSVHLLQSNMSHRPWLSLDQCRVLFIILLWCNPCTYADHFLFSSRTVQLPLGLDLSLTHPRDLFIRLV